MPLPSKSNGLPSAVDDLGMGGGMGDMLGQQVAGETEEMRRKRMAEMQQRQMGGGSLATMSLLGGGAGG